jgi:trehalose-phosphatase
VLRLIKVELTKRLSGVKGVFVEDKGLTLCLHYRLVGTKYIPEVKNIFRKIVGHHPISGKIRVESGKMMLEVRPAINWDKGKIVLWLLAKQRLLNKAKILPLYIGDDITDEDAFRAIRKKGITVFVGSPRRSYAKYYVKSPREVVKLLKTFTVLRPFAPLRCKNKS